MIQNPLNGINTYFPPVKISYGPGERARRIEKRILRDGLIRSYDDDESPDVDREQAYQSGFRDAIDQCLRMPLVLDELLERSQGRREDVKRRFDDLFIARSERREDQLDVDRARGEVHGIIEFTNTSGRNRR